MLVPAAATRGQQGNTQEENQASWHLAAPSQGQPMAGIAAMLADAFGFCNRLRDG